jgi:hypothetical protein
MLYKKYWLIWSQKIKTIAAKIKMKEIKVKIVIFSSNSSSNSNYNNSSNFKICKINNLVLLKLIKMSRSNFRYNKIIMWIKKILKIYNKYKKNKQI